MTAKKALTWSYKNLWPMPATTVMVSCVGKDRPPNIITFGACGIACARPPLISLAFGVNRYSYELVKETKDFVVNIPSNEQALITDWCGRVSGREVDKFKEGNLTPGESLKVKSPYIVECPVNYECTLWNVVNCGSHDLVLGEVQQVHVDESILNEKGDAIDTSKFNPLVSLQMEYWDFGKKLGEWGGLWKSKS
ncbi:flavin reductase family protein [Candidatus Poribacteria bacterium]|nr:flavin reductase family protein [Candidatus Poribacteria bacterium]